MLKVEFYNCNEIEQEKLRFAVVAARYNGKWVFVRHKQRKTWEIPGGHREQGEEIGLTSRRELYEETGAVKYDIEPVCVYRVYDNDTNDDNYGMMFYAEVKEFAELPEFEIGEVAFSETLPDKLTYPLIQPELWKKVKDYIR